MRLADYEIMMILKAFEEKLHECNQHKLRLLSAKKMLKSYMPLDVNDYSYRKFKF